MIPQNCQFCANHDLPNVVMSLLNYHLLLLCYKDAIIHVSVMHSECFSDLKAAGVWGLSPLAANSVRFQSVV